MIQKNVNISFGFYGDTASTVLTLDLERDPFSVDGSPNLVNWAQDARTNKPTAAKNGTTTLGHVAFTATVSYPTLTLTFATAPGFSQDTVDVILLFD